MSKTPVLDFIEAAEADGWLYEPPGRAADPNPKALTVGGTTYSTLVGDGVRVAVGSLLLYYHGGRVWRGCPVADASKTRVVIEAIVVDPARRRSGVGAETIKRLQGLAASLGLELWIEAVPIPQFKAKGQRTITGRRLVDWYKSLGFEPAYPGEGETILTWKFGRGHAVRKGTTFRHRRATCLDASGKATDQCVVTAVRKGVAYYRFANEPKAKNYVRLEEFESVAESVS